jgi:hypothetical protein
VDAESIRLSAEVARTAVVAWASKDLAAKILGPTAEYLGGEIARFAERCNINLDRIFRRAAEKLGPLLELQGEVHPRVLRGVIEEGAFLDDTVATEYFAGVLAAARSEHPATDRAVADLALLRQMSTLQMRLHYFIYRAIKQLYDGRDTKSPVDCSDLGVFLSDVAITALVREGTRQPSERAIQTAIIGLHRLELIGPFTYKSQTFVARRFASAPSDGLLVEPEPGGIQLFLAAHGYDEIVTRAFLRRETICPDPPGVALPDGGVVAARFEPGV